MHIKETEAWQGLSVFEDIASKLSWVAANSAALQVLIVQLYIREFDDDQEPAMFEWVHALAEQLAACRPRLHAFGCRARDLNTFPVIPNLKHLMLDVRYASLETGVGSLVALKSLETLRLAGRVRSKYERSEPPKCPSIELSSLSRLLRVALVAITPGSISISSCCAVHVKLIGTYSGSHPVWSAFCIAALRSISWIDTRSHVSIGTPQEIPRAMREASCLDNVYISLSGQWSCENLPSALARVRRLTIKSERIMLCVPAKVQWQQIYLTGRAHQGLDDVKFEDVDAFVKVPMNFHFGSYKPLGRSWLQLDAALVKSKPEWVSKAKQITHRCVCADKCKCVRYRDYIYELTYEHFPGKSDGFMHCTCGDCIDCLRRIGSL